MKNKKLIKNIIIGLLMLTVLIVSLVLLKNKLSGRDYTFIGLKFKNFLAVEIIQFIIQLLLYLSIVLIGKKYKTYYKTMSVILFISLFLNFYLIAFKFYSYAGFINTVILYITLMIDKKNNLVEAKKKWNHRFHFFVVKDYFINYNLGIDTYIYDIYITM